MNFEQLKFSIQKMIDHKDTDFNILYTILSNIKNNVDVEKYKNIKGIKINSHTKDILLSIGFKQKVVMFEEFYVFQDSSVNFSTMELFIEILDTKKEFLQKKKQHTKSVIKLIEKDKQQKQIVHNELMGERTHRRKFNGWLT
jgi:hypothetical protein